MKAHYTSILQSVFEIFRNKKLKNSFQAPLKMGTKIGLQKNLTGLSLIKIETLRTIKEKKYLWKKCSDT